MCVGGWKHANTERAMRVQTIVTLSKNKRQREREIKQASKIVALAAWCWSFFECCAPVASSEKKAGSLASPL